MGNPATGYPAILETLSTEVEIENAIGKPNQRVLAKAINALDDICRSFIARSPFGVVACSDAAGNIDVSPRETRQASYTCWTTALSRFLSAREIGAPIPFEMCCRTPRWG